MTTVAFDGRYMAADSCRLGTYASNDAVKLHIASAPDSPLRIIAGTGSDSALQVLFKWFDRGMPADDMPKIEDKETGGMVWEDNGNGGDFYYFDDLIVLIPDSFPASAGSGSNLAMGAMLAGKNAMEAVHLSIPRDPYTLGPVLYVDTTLTDLEVKTYRTSSPG